MAKPTTEMKLRSEYTSRGYVADEKKYICPTCDANFLKMKGHKGRINHPGLWKNYAVCVLIFRKPDHPSIAACPKCGLRRSDKHLTPPNQPEDNGKCHGKKKDGADCTRSAQSNGYCYQHQGQVPDIPSNI